MRLDLHTHSHYSDGTCAPAEVVRRAKASGVELLVLTDHDSVSGFGEAREAARRQGITTLCGIEINTAHPGGVHILGYGLRWRDPAFLERLAAFRERRRARVERIVEALRRLGLSIRLEDVVAQGREALGRPHVADALRRGGFVASRQEAFNRFLARGKPGYVGSAGPSPEEAIALIRGAGGFCSLAHPETVSEEGLLAGWKEAGLEGLEAYYGSHRASQTARYLRLASDLGLLATGGSDFHGPGSGRDKPLGVEVPDEVHGRFMERLS
ncbi:MAG: PHP domain-containing protein, partial [Elusimicrobia bacterium]|nr:PHP domain-containing protein [Elusimicrobiota bacterium]